LIHHTAWPGHLQDAASAYHFLVRELSIDPARIVLIGDSAGGNICLGLARWLRDAAGPTLGRPAGLLLFSPWTSPSHAFPYEPNSHIPRPNRETVIFGTRLCRKGAYLAGSS
jgi:acetyl esterase/lipase